MATNATSSLAPLLARKLKKVLDTRVDSPEILSSFSALSEFYTENTASSRKHLRGTLEKRGIDINEEFLKASLSAQQALDAVETEVNGLAQCCERIAKSLDSCSASTGDMMVATERLKVELESSVKRQQLVASFLHNYQLTAEEVAALREEELDVRFFQALARVQEIHSNCKVLLRTHHQRAGLELMDVMAVYQEGAYERLCRWVQAECRSLGDSDTPEVSDLLRTAAICLKDRPVLFKYCAEEVANTRHNALFRRFISALTRGGPGGTPRPIEVHAHDPLRYVGDMLAWLHQALASERELAAALFGGVESQPEAQAQSPAKSTGEASDSQRRQAVAMDLATVLDRVFDGVCRPFKVRVEQVLTGQPNLILIYNLTNLLAFYYHTIGGLLGDNAALSATLREVCMAAQRSFFDALQTRGDRLLRFPFTVLPDLSPPPAVSDTLLLLLELMDTHSRVMVGQNMQKPDFQPVMQAVLAPLIQMCERAAESLTVATVSGVSGAAAVEGSPQPLSRTRPPILGPNRKLPSDPAASKAILTLRHIFLVNCLAAIQQPLVGHDVAESQLRQLEEAIQGHLAALVDGHVADILIKCHLTSKLAAMSSVEKGAVPLATVPDLSPSAVADSLRSLFGQLAGSEGTLPEFTNIQVPSLRAEACNRVSAALADAYETVFTALMDPVNQYPDPRSMLRHTPDQMRTILGI